jgi:tetratricopeptide (TPR) repeat protein
MSHRTYVLVLAAALAVVSGSATVHAQQPAAGDARKEQARQLHEQGLRHYEARQYGRAIGAYRKAYALVPVPGILFNLAQAYRLKGDCRRAHRAYRSFLRAAPGTPEAKLAQEHVTALRPCAVREKERKAAGLAAVGTATGATAAQPAPRGPATPAGTTSSQPQFSDGSPFDAPPAEGAPGEPAPAPAVDLASTRDHGAAPGRRKKMVGLGVGAAGAVLTVVGVYYGLRANSDASDLNEFFNDGGTWTPELAGREDALSRNRALALGFSLFGAAAVGTGAVFYWLGHQEATAAGAARRSSMSIAPQPNGAVLQWRGEF